MGISILDFSLFPEQEDLHSTFRFYDTVHQRTLTDVLEIHYKELKKFHQNQPQGLRTRLERWLHILKFGQFYQHEATTIPEVLKEDEEVLMVIKAFQQVSASEEVHEIMEARLKAEHDEATRLFRAREEGIEQEREESRKRIRQVARKLREQGLSEESIFEATGLRFSDF